MMNRRRVFTLLGGIALTPWLLAWVSAKDVSTEKTAGKIVRDDAQWRELLTPGQYEILREEGTEPAGSSRLLYEKRSGTYACAGCGNPLFESSMKYDSGTGWPSFFTVIDGAVGTRRDFKLFRPRTEYHCARCGGHHGHVFNDGPKPTGLRYCNNGLALNFVPEDK